MLGAGNGITHKKNQDMLKSRDEFIALAMKENRSHHRCMMLGAIYQECLFLRGEEHPAFLNWCLERMVREGESPSIRALCETGLLAMPARCGEDGRFGGAV